MNESIAIIISVTIYKLFSLAVGLLISYMGYRLFIAKITGDAGNLQTKYRNLRLELKKSAPGTFFAVFGAIILGFTIFHPLEFDYKTGNDAQCEKSNPSNNYLPFEREQLHGHGGSFRDP